MCNPAFYEILVSSTDWLRTKGSDQEIRYLIERLSKAEDEVDSAFDVAIFEVVSSKEVTHCVLDSYEAAVVERCLVPCYEGSNCTGWSRAAAIRVLEVQISTTINFTGNLDQFNTNITIFE